ncbi:dipeptide epimerase [Weizmannia acidilactici]|uniref:Dipeptide epimerase n=1 Tax=Weizmannia acidilactici TaxID=2607726 RepID=A0A5J4J8H6_9BACI|nr:dipeptide epimerase [Weizmannia acidilactici]GER67787.1 dipeptide epimerase [Weizmannia acidilactici]GER71172.1 dipeptide epimerase [Weizmannia acidilactici]GER74042.1 dipeptide epimerase [Weizmannia acidilactici]
MIIKDVQVHYRNIPLLVPFKTALRTANDIDSVDVNVILDNGIIGMGAAAPAVAITGDSTESIMSALLGPIKGVLVGHDLNDFQTALKKVQLCCIGNTSAKAAANMALYDAYCKWLNIPLYAYLGGRKNLQTSMTIGVDTPEKMAWDAEKSVEAGFHLLKIKVGTHPELDINRIEAIRRAVPPDTKFRLDANQAWEPKQAVQILRELEKRKLGIEFVEQPVSAHDWEGLKYVTERTCLPVMADESLFTAKDALKLVSGRYVDLINIKLMKCGGITEAWKIAGIAEANGVKCMVGSMMEPSLSVAAAAHFAAAHPNVYYLDLDAPLWLSEEPDHLTYDGENVLLPGRPGIGVVQPV